MSGAIAACILGTFAALAGPEWAVLLVLYFVLSSALSHLGRARKLERLRGIVEKAGARDARQVAANGAVFGIAAVGALIDPTHLVRWQCAAIGALAASASDTIATEIGTWLGGTPWSVRTWTPVPTGTSGAVSLAGVLGMVGGALAVAALGVVLLRPDAPTTAVLGWLTVAGIAGAMTDTVLGASVQQRRWCARCQMATEQHRHTCGAPTEAVGGSHWLENDGVNTLCTVVGAIIGAGGGYLSR